MTSPAVLAIIPARAGSKGLPGKNVRPLAGIPLIAHSIRCAAMSPEVTRCIVSTDGEEIAAVARANGGDVPFIRPADLASDTTAMMPVLQHALGEVERLEGRRYDFVLLLDPTSPGRLPSDIHAAVSRLSAAAPEVEGVVACSRPHFNPLWVGVVERNGFMAPAFPGARFTRRQDVPDFFRINGALYLWRRDFVAAGGPDWPNDRHLLLEMPEERAFSIDTLAEFQMADLAIQHHVVRLPWMENV